MYYFCNESTTFFRKDVRCFSARCPFGKMSFGKMSFRQDVFQYDVLSARWADKALDWLRMLWDNVTPTTIKHCSQHVGFKNSPATEETSAPDTSICSSAEEAGLVSDGYHLRTLLLWMMVLHWTWCKWSRN